MNDDIMWNPEDEIRCSTKALWWLLVVCSEAQKQAMIQYQQQQQARAFEAC